MYQFLLSLTFVTNFVYKLQNLSKSLSSEDEQILRKVILAKSKATLTRF